MKKLLAILFLFFPIVAFGQNPGPQSYIPNPLTTTQLTLVPSTDSNATTINTANQWQTLFAANAGTSGTYVQNTSTSNLCVSLSAQTSGSSCSCGSTPNGQGIIVVYANGQYFPFGLNSSSMSICGSVAGQTFTKGAY